jgi:hypothetical protein
MATFEHAAAPVVLLAPLPLPAAPEDEMLEQAAASSPSPAMVATTSALRHVISDLCTIFGTLQDAGAVEIHDGPAAPLDALPKSILGSRR